MSTPQVRVIVRACRSPLSVNGLGLFLVRVLAGDAPDVGDRFPLGQEVDEVLDAAGMEELLHAGMAVGGRCGPRRHGFRHVRLRRHRREAVQARRRCRLGGTGVTLRGDGLVDFTHLVDRLVAGFRGCSRR